MEKFLNEIKFQKPSAKDNNQYLTQTHNAMEMTANEFLKQTVKMMNDKWIMCDETHSMNHFFDFVKFFQS